MNKHARRALITVTAIVAAVAVGLTTTTVVGVVASEAEKDLIAPYGQLVEVDGKDMNVLITGDGPQTVVLLPGFGTSSPALDFGPLLPGLAADHRVVVVEPFGYGLSDGTDVPRTTANIVEEVHEALQSLDIDSYVLMGHSIAGVYALEYVEQFRDEVEAFVGIDTSVPGQPNMDASFPIGLLSAMRDLGIARLLTAMGSPGPEGDAYTDQDRQQMRLFSNRNGLAPTYLDEMSRIAENFRNAQGTVFPADLPLLLFVEEDNASNPEWAALHEEQAATVTDGTVIALPGEHYLHHTEARAIVDAFVAWEGERMLSSE